MKLEEKNKHSTKTRNYDCVRLLWTVRIAEFDETLLNFGKVFFFWKTLNENVCVTETYFNKHSQLTVNKDKVQKR